MLEQTIVTHQNHLDPLQSKFTAAQEDNSTYRNCAGFVSYMMGLDNKETMVKTTDLVARLTEVSRVPITSFDFEDFSTEDYLSHSQNADAVSVFIDRKPIPNPKTIEDMVNNSRTGPQYLLALTDPNDKTMIYQRPDIEHTPQHVKWDNILNELGEFEGEELHFVFFKK